MGMHASLSSSSFPLILLLICVLFLLCKGIITEYMWRPFWDSLVGPLGPVDHFVLCHEGRGVGTISFMESGR